MSFHRARIEELPFEDRSFDAVISNGVVNLSADKRRVSAEATGVLRPGGRLALADIVTERQIATRTSCQAVLWAACVAGTSQRDLYLEDVAAAGLGLQLIHANPGYRFTSEQAQRAGHKYGAHSVSLLALNPPAASRHGANAREKLITVPRATNAGGLPPHASPSAVMILVSATRPRSTHSLGAELERSRLKRRLREKTVAIAWMRQYMREEREPSVAPRYVRQASGDFEAQVEAINARLRDLAPHAGAMEDHAGRTYDH